MNHPRYFTQITWLEFNPRCTVCRVVTLGNLETAFNIAFMLAHPNYSFSASRGYYA